MADHITLAPWLIKAKVTPPKHFLALMDREAVMARLMSNVEKRVTVLEAPGGFGKSTVLAMWRQRLIAQQKRVAWLSLDGEDTVDILLAHLAYAFHLAGINMTHTRLMEDHTDGPQQSLLDVNRIVHEIEKLRDSVVLMLDDGERLNDEASVEALDHLIRQAPENLHIALAYRRNPGLGLSRLSVQGMLDHIQVEHLRFNRNEISAYFGKELTDQETQTIGARTEGWPVALQLIRSASREQGNIFDTLHELTDRDGLGLNYFEEQIFHRLSQADQKFLMEVSVLEWIEPDIADAVLHCQDSREGVRQLTHLEGLILSLDDRVDTYRLHPLLREYLQSASKRRDPDQYRLLHQRAALVLFQHGRLLVALRHAKKAGDRQLLGELVESAGGGARLWLMEGLTRLTAVDRLIDDATLNMFPRLALARCITFIKQGCLKEAQHLFECVHEQTLNFTKDRAGGDLDALDQDRIFVDSMLTVYRCQPITDALLEPRRTPVEMSAHHQLLVLGHRNNFICVAHHQSARFDESIKAGRQAQNNLREAGSVYGPLFIDFHLGSICVARGEPEQANKYFMSVRETCRQKFPQDAGLKLISDILIAELDLEQNRLSALPRRLSNINARLHSSEAWFDIYAAAYATASEKIYLKSGIEEALEFLNEARRHAERLALARIDGFVTSLEVTLLCLSGEGEKALRKMRGGSFPNLTDAPLSFDDGWTWREAEAWACASLRLYRYHKDWEKARGVIAKMEPLFEERDVVRSLMCLWVGAALTEWASDEMTHAGNYLLRALKAAAANGYERVFFRDRREVEPILEFVVDEFDRIEEKEELVSYARDLLARLQQQKVSDSPSLTFSPRELEVLRELNKGLQDKVIARRLGVTEHAVRYHLRNIYAKTHSNSRLQAVRKARQGGFVL